VISVIHPDLRRRPWFRVPHVRQMHIVLHGVSALHVHTPVVPIAVYSTTPRHESYCPYHRWPTPSTALAARPTEYKVCACWSTSAPSYLAEVCIQVSVSVSPSHLRSAAHGDLVLPLSRTTRYGQRSFADPGPTLWNTLPLTVCVSGRCHWLTFYALVKTILFTTIASLWEFRLQRLLRQHSTYLLANLLTPRSWPNLWYAFDKNTCVWEIRDPLAIKHNRKI